MFKLENLVRNNIKNLEPYSSARDEYKGDAKILLDANENGMGNLFFNGDNALENNYHRYPDPQQSHLKKAIARLKGLNENSIFLGNGSDECIDVLYRCFCEPSKDNVIICPPTYGMYKVAANIQNVEIREVLLKPDFQMNCSKIEKAIDENTKLIWLCSPNNPTGNIIERSSIIQLLQEFRGIVVVDEAYIDFSSEPSLLSFLQNYPNLVILQTFSKAWGLAGLRLGMAFASPAIITIMNKVKPPYNINTITQEYIISAIAAVTVIDTTITKIVANRKKLAANLADFPFVRKVFNSDANFLLVKMDNAKSIYRYLLTEGIVVRNRSDEPLCSNCLRITVGSDKDNDLLIKALTKYSTITDEKSFVY